jgi:anti-anti-sigma factor
MTDPLVGLTITVTPRPPETVVAIVGELDLANVGAADAVLAQICGEARGDLVLDLTAIDFIGFAGTEMLRDVHRRLAATGRRLTVGDTNATVAHTFELTGHPCGTPRRPTSADGPAVAAAGAEPAPLDQP